MDYKGAATGDGHFAQIALTVPVLLAGLVLVLIGPRPRGHDGLRALTMGALILAVPASVVTQCVQQNDLQRYLRVLLPFALFQLGFAAACRPWQEARLAQFEKAMFWANGVSLAFTCLYGLVIAGPLEDVRYRIVSVTFLGLQGVLLHEFVVAKRYSALTLGLFMATVVIELLSVTRSLLIGTGLLFALAVWMAVPLIAIYELRRDLPDLAHNRPRNPWLVLACVVPPAWLLSVYVGAQQVDRGREQ